MNTQERIDSYIAKELEFNERTIDVPTACKELTEIAEQNMSDALADDMEGFVILYQQRIKELKIIADKFV